jgi:hypothetical protein
MAQAPGGAAGGIAAARDDFQAGNQAIHSERRRVGVHVKRSLLLVVVNSKNPNTPALQVMNAEFTPSHHSRVQSLAADGQSLAAESQIVLAGLLVLA